MRDTIVFVLICVVIDIIEYVLYAMYCALVSWAKSGPLSYRDET